jgi:zinc and cadmium transporter
MSPVFLIPIYCLLLAAASFAGGWLPSLIQLTHLRKQLIISVVAGVILTVALLHMLPHAISYLKSGLWVGGSMLCGLLVMFFLVRVFQTHPHDDVDLHHHEHDHDTHRHETKKNKSHHWVGLLVGLTLHSLLDGVAIAASISAEASHLINGRSNLLPILGLGTFLAVLLHKPLDALAITSLMESGDAAKGDRRFVNIIFALTCPCGILLFWIVASQIDVGQSLLLGCALAFSAGLFLCIALSDLLPEVAFHSHDRGKLSAALLLGVGIAVAVELLHSHRSPVVDLQQNETNVTKEMTD